MTDRNAAFRFLAATCAVVAIGAVDSSAWAGACTPSTGPDVVVGMLTGVSKWGTVGQISAYSIGTTSCNIGDANLPWIAHTNQHPVIAQNMYRLKGGRFEQIGMSWLKHGWGALTQTLCCPCQDPFDFEALGVGCSDPYDSGLNGNQIGLQGGTVAGLGPRSEVNASTGAFLFPYGSQGVGGDAIYKRLQIHISDLDPAQNPGATYYAEAHYVTPHDATAGNKNNNASYRQMTVGTFTGGSYNLAFTGLTQVQAPAIFAWQAADPMVGMVAIDVPGDGRMILGSRCTDNGDGTWHYEYALYNMNSHRSAAGFSIPIPAGVTVSNIGFHDVDYHSGEPYSLTDWPGVVSGGQITWSTQSFAANPNANALRWGTLYNFRFDAAAAPASVNATIGLFRSGSPASMSIVTCGPSGPPPNPDLSGDGIVNTIDLGILLAAWSIPPGAPACGGSLPCPADINHDGFVNTLDLGILLSSWTL